MRIRSIILFCTLCITAISFGQNLAPEREINNPLAAYDGSFQLDLDGQSRVISIDAVNAQYNEYSETNVLLSSGSVTTNDAGFVLIPGMQVSNALITEPVRVVIFEENNQSLLVEVRFLNSRNGRIVTIQKV